jgi:hypothetical protein
MTSTDRIDGVPVIDSYRLTYVPRLRRLVGELSDLGLRSFVPGTLYVRSARTGDILKFTGVPAERDAENDVVAYRYRNVGHKLELSLIND